MPNPFILGHQHITRSNDVKLTNFGLEQGVLTGFVLGVPSARGLRWVDLHIERSAVSPILADGQLGSWARWWNTQIKANPTQVHEQMGHPVITIN